jgi:hypothetical protein
MHEFIAAVEKYGGGLVFYLISAFKPENPREPALALSRSEPSLLVFSILSLALAGVVYPVSTGALSGSNAGDIVQSSTLVAETIAIAAIYWALQAILVYFVGSAGRPKEPFTDVLSAILRVFPAAFLVAAAVRFVVWKITGPIGELDSLWAGALAFIIVHVSLIAWRLPATLRAIAWMRSRARVAAAAAALMLAIVVDVYSIYGPVLLDRAQAQTSQSPPGNSSGQTPTSPGSVLCGGCTIEPGRPPGRDDSVPTATGATTSTSVTTSDAATGSSVTTTTTTNGPIPDTAENRKKYGGPMSRAGKRTAAKGN